MGIDINGSTITQASSILTVNTGVPMTILSTGAVVRPNQTQFIARGGGSDWVYLSNGWNAITTFTLPQVNVNACYDSSNSRFTAPVNGMYFFQVAGSHLLKDGASVSYYWHPVFGVNGDPGGRTVYSNYSGGSMPNYRLRGHGVSIASYDDGSIGQVYKLLAGDYVEFWMYSNGSPTNRYYPPYEQWSGVLLG